MWTGGPLAALFFAIATGNFRAQNEFKTESYPDDVVTCAEINHYEWGLGNWCPLFANGIFFRVVYEIRVTFTDRLKAPNAKGAYAVIRGRSSRLDAIHIQMKMTSELVYSDYYQVEWDPRLEIPPPDIVDPGPMVSQSPIKEKGATPDYSYPAANAVVPPESSAPQGCSTPGCCCCCLKGECS